MQYLELIYFMEEQIPFNKYLGMKFIEVQNDAVIMKLPFREEFVGDPHRRAMHGGVLSSVMDVAGGTACWASIGDIDARVSTVDMRVDFLLKGPCEDLICRAAVVRTGNRVAVARMELVGVSNPEQVVATGQAVYNIVKKNQKHKK